jgi:hypothetical protein
MKRKLAPVLWMSMAFGVALALAVAVLADMGTDTKGIGVALRLTARWSFLLFWTAYAAAATATLFGPIFAPLARRGREFGLAFAAAHLVHIGLVIWLYRIAARPPLSDDLFVFFTVGIGWTYLLAVLSFGGLSAVLGPRLWHWVRVLGMNYILLAFARDFVLSAIHSVSAHQGFWRSVDYVIFAVMGVAAPCLSLAVAVQRRWGLRRAVA